MSADRPLVGILVGSESDRERMQGAIDELEQRGLAHEFEVRSAHRQPDAVAEYARSARERGLWIGLQWSLAVESTNGQKLIEHRPPLVQFSPQAI